MIVRQLDRQILGYESARGEHHRTEGQMRFDEQRKEHQDHMQTLPAEHLRKRNLGGTFRLFGDEQPLEGSNVTCLESGRVTTRETLTDCC